MLLRPGKEDDEPQQHVVAEPGIGADSGARVLAVWETNTAVYLPVAAAPGRRDRRDRHHGGEHAAAQAAVELGGGVAGRAT